MANQTPPYRHVVGEDPNSGKTADSEDQQRKLAAIHSGSTSPEFHSQSQGSMVHEDSGAGTILNLDDSGAQISFDKVWSQSPETVNQPRGDGEMHSESECLETAKVLDGRHHGLEKVNLLSLPVETNLSLQSLHVEAVSCDDSGHIDNVSDCEEDSSYDDLKHSMSSQGSFIAVGVLDVPISKDADVSVEGESNISMCENPIFPQGENTLNDIATDDSGNRNMSRLQEDNDQTVGSLGKTSLQIYNEASKMDISTDKVISVPDKKDDACDMIQPSDKSGTTRISNLSDVAEHENANEGFFEKSKDSSSLGDVNKVSRECAKRAGGEPIESGCLKYLIGSASDNTDSEENGTSAMPSVVDNQSASQQVEPVTAQPYKSVSVCKGINVLSVENKASDQIVHYEYLDGREIPSQTTLQAKTSVETNTVANLKGVESLDKLCFSYVPARSSAKKALSKMKSTLEEEGDTESDKNSGTEAKKTKPVRLKIKTSGEKVMKTFGKTPLLQPRNSFGVASTSSIATSTSLYQTTKSIYPMYKCEYCVDIHPGSLKKIKTHLRHRHKNMPPVVINCSKQKEKKKCKSFVCPHLSCFKLFYTVEDLDNHKHTHAVHKKPKERTTLNSSCSSTGHSFIHHVDVSQTKVPSSSTPLHPQAKTLAVPNTHSLSTMPKIRSCRVELRNLGISEVQAITQRHKRHEAKYLCLYCTDYVYESSLSAMKSHYIQEHEGQMMVMRDTEARRAQQPSRIYVCSSPGCEYNCVSKHGLDAHVRLEHSTSSCSYVYQCALCGWFTSSHASANQHLQSQHSPDEGASLVHMQVMVDEFGQTSKKIV
ncbi:hypothetical protein ElyMa_005116400 [Elysia marginata]|uniref:C2H2-type domain-containing protein n=1 Tax=Elysia marginata TaxID=1093978 RepID=A0AAV4JMI9_9GAST|nr:hypothetical protein ElyMa_005116400 [Elysia marginata]